MEAAATTHHRQRMAAGGDRARIYLQELAGVALFVGKRSYGLAVEQELDWAPDSANHP